MPCILYKLFGYSKEFLSLPKSILRKRMDIVLTAGQDIVQANGLNIVQPAGLDIVHPVVFCHT